MGLLNRDEAKQSLKERGELRRHLRDLDDVREEKLRDLGGLALEMYTRDRFEGDLLWSKAAEIAAVDDDAKLVRRGLEEGLTLKDLEEIAREKAGPESPK